MGIPQQLLPVNYDNYCKATLIISSTFTALGWSLVTGDVLFYESIGRTDLPGGDLNTLLDSIRQQLFTLPGETLVYAGHGDTTTIRHEMEYNPFL